MNNVAMMMCESEKKLALDAFLVDTDKPETWKEVVSDINVVHTHLSMDALYSKTPIVFIPHGTPEVMFQSSYEQSIVYGAYGHADGWMLSQYWTKKADATVTFWPRHAALLKSMADKKTAIHTVPMGIDLDFWKPVRSDGKYLGTPSVFTAENAYLIKWPYDLFIAWPWVREHEKLHEAKLHAIYLPKDQHRFFFPLVNANGASFGGFITAITFEPTAMRNAYCSTDFYVNLVRYGDFNTITLEARACGAKVISYRGNPYANYWIDEGDQRVIAEQLIDIFTGTTPERTDITKVEPMETTASAMKEIYEHL